MVESALREHTGLDVDALGKAVHECWRGGLVVVANMGKESEIQLLENYVRHGSGDQVVIMRAGRPLGLRITAHEALMVSATKLVVLVCDWSLSDLYVAQLQERIEWLIQDPETLAEIAARRAKRGDTRDAGESEMLVHFFD